MNEAIEQPVAAEPEVLEAPAETSVADHKAQFGAEALQERAKETPEERTEREHHSAQQKRDRENGQFKPGQKRHVAQSHLARPEDVPRIQALTGRAKSAEERLAAAEAEITRLKSVQAPPQQIARAEAKAEQARPAVENTDQEPVETDPKFEGDYGKFLMAQARWAARDEHRSLQRQATEAQTKAKQQETQRGILEGFATRAEAAKAKYRDFEQVAFGPTRIPSGSTIDAFIMEDDAGAEILYHLQSHPEDVDSLLGMSVLAQAKHLSLLSQRLLSPQSAQAGTTGAAAGRPAVVLPHRPPTPVRTEAQRAVDGPPPTDGSLTIAEHKKNWGKR